MAALLPTSKNAPQESDTQRTTFLKLKGGGSLIIALPALLAMRRAVPTAEFILVCTSETKIYAELTGIFDRYTVIDDTSLVSLIKSSHQAWRDSFRTDICIDLEPNSILAAVFSLLTLAYRRLGFVKPDEHYRNLAYTDALSFNVFAPIYVYYDQLAELLGARPSSATECRTHFLQRIPSQQKAINAVKTIGIAAFTSDFAPERMMPVVTWIELLKRHIGTDHIQIVLFGSAKNKSAAEVFLRTAQQALPTTKVTNMCGQGNLAEAVAVIANLDEFWAIDSGLLHIARLLGVNCRSFWGPTNPSQRLRSIDGLDEVTFYHNFVCSPCVHIKGPPPCKGNNLCLKTMAEPDPNRAPLWTA